MRARIAASTAWVCEDIREGCKESSLSLPHSWSLDFVDVKARVEIKDWKPQGV